MTTPQRALPSDPFVSDAAHKSETVATPHAFVSHSAPTEKNVAEDDRLCVCPCCGAEFAGDLRRGCTACGARSVGLPLAPPAIRLPRLGRAVAACVAGTAVALWLLTSTLVELFSGARDNFGFWRVVAAAETAAWKSKWTLLPTAVISAVVGVRYVLNARAAAGEVPFGGRRFARAGVTASAVVALSMLTLIGVTMPERRRQREAAHAAHVRSLEYAVQAAFMRYQTGHASLPGDLKDLRNLPDDDGMIAFVLANFDATAYTPSSVQATARPAKPPARKSVRVRTASYNRNSNTADTAAIGGLTFTNYDLVWAGADKILGTLDDRILRDGRFIPTPANGVTTPYAAESETAPAPVRARARKGTRR